MAMLFAWAVFWANTALFPCCEALAAVFNDHSDNISHSVSAAQPAHDTDETHSDTAHHNPDSPCGYTLDAGPAIHKDFTGPPAERAQTVWFAIDTPVIASLPPDTQVANFKPREYRPPPPFRLYLDTQRLLI